MHHAKLEFPKGRGWNQNIFCKGYEYSTMDKHNVNSNNASPQVLLLVKGDKQEEWSLWLREGNILAASYSPRKDTMEQETTV